LAKSHISVVHQHKLLLMNNTEIITGTLLKNTFILLAPSVSSGGKKGNCNYKLKVYQTAATK
jgi:hypothetical protein